MTEINLLPWREEQTKAKNNLFAVMVVVVVIVCSFLCFLINGYVKDRVEYETKEVELLSKEIGLLEGKIVQIKGLQEGQNLLLSKREIIQALQASRPFIVQIFEDVVKSVPDGLFLISMARKDNKLILQGVSNSNSRISSFMRNLEQLQWLKNSTLQEIKTEDVVGMNNDSTKGKQIVFKLQSDINH